MNYGSISGNLIRDAEIKYIGKNNTPCVEFVIAKNHKFKNERGNTEEQVMFFEVVLFGQFGERILQFLNKGKKVYIQGELRQEAWEYEGKKYARVKIIANRVYLEGQDKHKNQAKDTQSIESQTNGVVVEENLDVKTIDITDEDIPF